MFRPKRLVLATGATHSYFGHENWAPFAPGLKRIEDATEIRRRMLLALVVRLVSSLKANDLLLRMALLSVAANFALDYALMQRMGVAGIALATPLVALLSLLFLSYLLSRRVKPLALGAY